MNISYDYYRVFYHVARCRSFTKAAGVMMNNQGNVTRIIRSLESALGCTLFVRSNRGAELTPEGAALFAHVQIAYEQLRAGEEELLAQRSLQSGLVRIGASQTALHGVLLPALSRFHKTYPGVHLRVSNHTTPQALESLKGRLVDLAVVTTPFSVQPPLRAQPLRSFRDVAVCAPALAGGYRAPLTPEALAACPLVSLGRDSTTYALYSTLFRRRGLHFAPDMEAATTDQILPMVKSGLGVGLVPDFFAQPALEAGEVCALALAEPLPQRQICLVRRTDERAAIAAETLARLLAETAQQQAKA